MPSIQVAVQHLFLMYSNFFSKFRLRKRIRCKISVSAFDERSAEEKKLNFWKYIVISIASFLCYPSDPLLIFNPMLAKKIYIWINVNFNARTRTGAVKISDGYGSGGYTKTYPAPQHRKEVRFLGPKQISRGPWLLVRGSAWAGAGSVMTSDGSSFATLDRFLGAKDLHSGSTIKAVGFGPWPDQQRSMTACQGLSLSWNTLDRFLGAKVSHFGPAIKAVRFGPWPDPQRSWFACQGP